MKPNVVLILVDQMRRDVLGVCGHPLSPTPTLDMMKRHGTLFTRAYSAVPSCIAARAAILTGLSQRSHGRLGYQDGVPWNYPNTIASVFAEAGYHTQAVGKMHVHPARNLLGFHNVVLHDGYLHFTRNQEKTSGETFAQTDDYLHWLRQQLGQDYDLTDIGLDCNSWVARPWHLAEQYHPTNWCAQQSIDFLRRRDPGKPFFLMSSFVRPHSPLDPPPYYFDLYANRSGDIPAPLMGDWTCERDAEQRGLDIDALEGDIPPDALRRARAAYLGHVTHIDHQINRMLMAFREYGLMQSTIFLFASDHGDLLGDHRLFRKALPYEGSAGVPLILYDPANLLHAPQNQTVDAVAELRDIMPTLLDAAGIGIPDSVEGKSLLPLVRHEANAVRTWLHGEHAFGARSNHFLITPRDKLAYFPETGREQYFDLIRDPLELHDAIGDVDCQARVAELREGLRREMHPADA